MANPVSFSIVGGGWRALYFLRIAQELPERFRVSGMVVRDAGKAAVLEQNWGVRTYRTLDELLRAEKPAFVVTSVSWEANPSLVQELAERGLPVISETPPAPDVERMARLWQLTRKGARIQVAEQYIYQPHHAARLAFVATGALGTVSQAQVSVAHGYHGVSLLRHFLGIGFENARITGCRFVSPIVAGMNKWGVVPESEQVVDSSQTMAWLDFGGRLGLFDFTGDQYFSWVRGQRLLVRGVRGEIIDTRASYLLDHRTPMEVTFTRVMGGASGNLEGHCLTGILAGERWFYRNSFMPARLKDDEIAVATLLARMAEYVQGGPAAYALAEACQDRYLDMCIARAVESGQPVTTETQVWAT